VFLNLRFAIAFSTCDSSYASRGSVGTFTTATLIPGYSALRRVLSSVVSRFVSRWVTLPVESMSSVTTCSIENLFVLLLYFSMIVKSSLVFAAGNPAMTKGLFCFPRTLCLPGLPGFGFLARHRLEPGQHISLHEMC